eukprot:COSAG02_NODE_30661_length_547_cov_1.022321_1_plen_22_part_10
MTRVHNLYIDTITVSSGACDLA